MKDVCFVTKILLHQNEGALGGAGVFVRILVDRHMDHDFLGNLCFSELSRFAISEVLAEPPGA